MKRELSREAADGWMSEVDTSTPWARASIALMRRISKVGTKAAIEEELENPQLADDQDWVKFIVSMTGDSIPTCAPENEIDFPGITYKCMTCMDRSYVMRLDEKGTAWSKPCKDCLSGKLAASGDVKLDQEDAVKKARAAVRVEDERREIEEEYRSMQRRDKKRELFD